jgi:hypothetical protein
MINKRTSLFRTNFVVVDRIDQDVILQVRLTIHHLKTEALMMVKC